MNQASLEPFYITVMKALKKMGQKTAGLEMIIGSCVERLSNLYLYCTSFILQTDVLNNNLLAQYLIQFVNYLPNLHFNI